MKKLVAGLMSLIVICLAASSAGAGAGNPDAETSAGQKARSAVSIEVWPNKGLFGYVRSGSKACKAKRQVVVYDKRGGELRKVGADRATKTDNGYIWSLKHRKLQSGTAVVSVAGNGRCAADRTKRTVPLGFAENIPVCPSAADICWLFPMRIEDDDSYPSRLCPRSFSEDRGDCKIEVTAGLVPFCCWDLGRVTWQKKSDTRRTFTFGAEDRIPSHSPPRPGPIFDGYLPNSSSANFYASSVRLPPWHEIPNAEWNTPYIEGAKPGTSGGPLYLNWNGKTDNHFSFYVYGFLYRVN